MCLVPGAPCPGARQEQWRNLRCYFTLWVCSVSCCFRLGNQSKWVYAGSIWRVLPAVACRARGAHRIIFVLVWFSTASCRPGAAGSPARYQQLVRRVLRMYHRWFVTQCPDWAKSLSTPLSCCCFPKCPHVPGARVPASLGKEAHHIP